MLLRSRSDALTGDYCACFLLRADIAAPHGLTGRQIEVLALVLQGKSNKSPDAQHRRANGEESYDRGFQSAECEQPH